MLFSDIGRSYDGPKLHSERDYFYLDRSARHEAFVIRDELEQWFIQFPESDRVELSSRFKSPDDGQHRSAAFELYLHQLFRRLGYAVKIHPETPSSKAGRPDFLLTAPDGAQMYVEAVQVTDVSAEEKGARERLNIVYDAINRLDSSGWFLGVDSATYPSQPPSARGLRQKVKRWLATLDPDHVTEEYRRLGNDALPTFNRSDGDWKIQFTAFPRAPDKRHEPVESILGALMGDARWLNTAENIRDTLLAKGSHYGVLGAPLVIALSANVLHLDQIDVMNALFGDEEYIVSWGKTRSEPRMQRARNGFWLGPKGPRYTRVAGVLIGYDVKPWTYGVRELVLYHNPWAASEVPGAICKLPRRVPINGTLSAVEGQHPKEILQLPNGYPGL